MRIPVLLLAVVGISGYSSRQQLPTAQTSLSSRFLSDGNPPPFGSWGNAAPAASPASVVHPVGGTSQQPNSAPSFSSASPLDSNDPIAALAMSQSTSVREILQNIPDLAPKPSLSWDSGSVSIAGCSASLAAYDAPGSANVAWLADVHVAGKISSLTIFNGPLTNVPHILSRCIRDGAMLHLTIDIRPRAYGAYELRDPVTGNYPGPDTLGRKAFEYSAARSEFFAKSGIDAFPSLLDPAQFEGAIPGTAPRTEYDVLTGGPLALHLTMPLTPQNIRQIAAIRECVASAWCTWVTKESSQHLHRPGAPVNTQYVYDSKFRQNAYLALRAAYSQAWGAVDGAKLAAAESGPLDEAYVGGGS
jgi:hypothetical protein